MPLKKTALAWLFRPQILLCCVVSILSAMSVNIAFAGSMAVPIAPQALFSQLPSGMVSLLMVTLALVALDTLLGWAGALAKGQFAWTKVGKFLTSSVLPYAGGLLALGILALVTPTSQPIFYASAAAADIQLISDILHKITALGVPVKQPPVNTPSPPAQ